MFLALSFVFHCSLNTWFSCHSVPLFRVIIGHIVLKALAALVPVLTMVIIVGTAVVMVSHVLLDTFAPLAPPVITRVPPVITAPMLRQPITLAQGYVSFVLFRLSFY